MVSSQDTSPSILAPGAPPWWSRLCGSQQGWEQGGVALEESRPTLWGLSPCPGLILWRVKCSGVSPPVSFPLYFDLDGSSHATKDELPLLMLGLKSLMPGPSQLKPSLAPPRGGMQGSRLSHGSHCRL